MADRRGLRMIGLVYGCVTAAVMLIGGLVVSSHALGYLTLDGAHPVKIQKAALGR